MPPRHAIYYAPPRASVLWQLGTSWLGRDPERETPVAPPVVPHIAPDRLEAMVAEPRRYGFHATLKPPFHLAEGCTKPALIAALEAWATTQTPFLAPPLALRAIGSFIALVPSAEARELDALAGRVVVDFDSFRAPPSAQEIARRRPERLGARQRAMLERWGYPYVLEEFRFHLTLTGGLAPDERHRALAALAPIMAPACRTPMSVAEVALYTEAAPGAAFILERRFPFGRENP